VEKPPFSEKFELISRGLVEAVAEKYDTYNKCKYIARKEHNESPIFYLVGSAKPMPVCSGRWATWEGWKRKPPSTRRTEADGGTIGRMVLGEHHAHHIGSPMQTRCQ
jgi:hypothetical protein